MRVSWKIGALAGLTMLALAACSSAPYAVAPSDPAVEAVPATPALAGPLGPFDYDPRPRAIAICYGNVLNEPAEVMALAKERCPYDGEVQRVDDDFFWNGCSLLQPQRASFICYPGPAPAPKYN